MASNGLLYVPHYSVALPSFSTKLRIPMAEVAINIKTGKGCAHGKCTFCGLNRAETERTQAPLTDGELHSQVQKGLRLTEANKLSIISNCHSTITPDVVSEQALISLVSFAAENGIRELNFETRMDSFSREDMQRILLRLLHAAQKFDISVEISCGIETPDEHERNAVMNKALTDAQIRSVAQDIFSYGFSLRAYHIFMPPTVKFKGEEAYTREMGKLLNMVKFLDSVKTHREQPIQLWVNVGYSPDASTTFVAPELTKVYAAMDMAALNAKSKNISMCLDLVEEDAGMVRSNTKRAEEANLRTKISERNLFGWLTF